MNRSLRLSDISTRIIAVAPASKLHAELEAIAARSMGRVPFINQSEEATPTELSSPTGGAPVPYSPANSFQDVDASRDDYRAGLSFNPTQSGVDHERT